MIPLSCQTGGNPSGALGTLGKSACSLPQGQRPFSRLIVPPHKAHFLSGDSKMGFLRDDVP